MKATTESALLKFMAKVSKAIDSEGEITPEDITPEMVNDADFQQRLRLYGHSVEEVEQLIADGKCIWAARVNDPAAANYEDLLYELATSFYDKDGVEILRADLNDVDYILYSNNNISSGILLHKNNDVFESIFASINVALEDDVYKIYVGFDTVV